ncbi:uncharacterized protein LOC133631461 [Entelurus aequoreus]|uniref:uncharacterized protein LOC133631461 n=1 Tax=Entelurus aequoreus TaxID=161455 RepID=UPI002B1E29F6|nr:uncharacterized protein LOC133631461 [Entelurus aequoreus]
MSPQLQQPATPAGTKLPEFWQSDPASWFQHIEALFHLRGIAGDDSRYYLVVTALDQATTRRAMQLLRTPPQRGKYAALKNLLLRRFTLTDAERADRLLSLPGLGDSTALDLMDSMLLLLGSEEGGFIFLHLFLRQLPPAARAVLANSASLASGDYRGLAEEADQVLLASRRFAVQSVEAPPLQTMENADPAVVAGVATRKRREASQCFFHQRFGANARRCVPPCSFTAPGNSNASVLRRFLVDSGSQVSLLPATDADRATGGCGPLLNAANGSSIDTFGSRLVTVCFHGRKFQWDFIIAAITLGLDFSGMAADQPDDPDIRTLKTDGTALVLEEVVVQDGGPALLCDVSTGRPRPVVPVDWRRQVFDAIHSLSHPGVRASVKLVGAKFVWPGLRKDVRQWAAACVACQRAKVHRHTKAALEPFPIPVRRFDHVHVDLVGPLPPSQGYTHLLTMVDRTTRWPEAVPLSSTASVDVARAFLSAWVARFGTPSDITSDRGSQFVSELWSALAQSLGVQVHRTTAYHPQANGLCERFHRSLKAALRAALVDSNWIDRLPWVMLGLRSAPKEDLAAAPAELVFGQPLRVPGEFLPEGCTPRPFPFLSRGSLAPGPIHHCFPKSFVPSELKSARFVFVRHDAHRSPLQPPYDGPFRVLERGPKNFVLDMGGRRECVSLDRLKPAHCVAGEEILPGQVPRRGRPPKSVRVECLSPPPDPDVCSAPQGTPASRDGHCSRYGRRVRPPDRFSFSP